MCDRYQSPPLAPCFDGDPPADEAPVETPAEETPLELYSSEQVAERLAERDREWEAKLTIKDDETTAVRTQLDANRIEQSLTVAISDGDAIHDEPLFAILRPCTSLIDGEPVVEIAGFTLTPAEAITWMRDNTDQYGHLFKSNVLNGLGANSTAEGMRGRKPVDIKNMSAGDYRRLRRENPAAVGFRGDR